MSAAQIFSIVNGVALLGWLTLIVAGRVRFIATVVIAWVVPALLSVTYLLILATHWAGHRGGFDSLDGVQLLFTDPWLVLLGWVHYLAFDLFVGAWQVRDAERCGIPHPWTIPTLILTFLFGPVGFLLYLVLRYAVSSRARALPVP